MTKIRRIVHLLLVAIVAGELLAGCSAPSRTSDHAVSPGKIQVQSSPCSKSERVRSVPSSSNGSKSDNTTASHDQKAAMFLGATLFVGLFCK